MLNHVPEIEIPSFTPSDRVINPDFGALRRGPGINRIVLIGNGFDLAHGLKTSYADFINWYWVRRAYGFRDEENFEEAYAFLSETTDKMIRIFSEIGKMIKFVK